MDTSVITKILNGVLKAVLKYSAPMQLIHVLIVCIVEGISLPLIIGWGIAAGYWK